MPNPVNENRPKNLDYKHGRPDAAAYRPSISLKEAAKKIKTSPRGEALKRNGVKFTSILKDIIVSKKHYRSKFNTNPWVGNVNAVGKEYTVETEKWRLVSFSTNGKPSEWFLAHHVGANNGFEFWHIANTNSLKGATQRTTQPVQPTVCYDIVDDQWGDTVEVFQPLRDEDVPDNWDDDL